MIDSESIRALRRAFEDILWRVRSTPGARLDVTQTRDLRRVYSMGAPKDAPEIEDAGYSLTLSVAHPPLHVDTWAKQEERIAASHYFEDDPEGWYAVLEGNDPAALGKAVALALGVPYTTPEALIGDAHRLRRGLPK